VTVLPWKSHVASYCIADGSLDFVFIDADHHYPHVIEDIRDWFPKIRSGGLISGHDFAHPDYPDWGVEKAVREYFGDNFEATGHDFVWFSWKS
jgi:predicted O-methyltransferase YrrM